MILRTIRRGLCLLILLGLAGCSVEVPEQLFLEGMQALQTTPRNYIYAIMQFEKFVAKYPEHEYVPAALMEKSRCHHALRDYEEALASCDQVIARFPRTRWEVEAMFLKSEVYQAQQRWKRSVEICKQVQQRVKHIPRLYQDASMRLAATYVYSASWPMAVAAYEEMIQSASIDSQLKPSLYIYKGRSLAEQGLIEQAQESFTALQQAYPESLEAIRAEVEIAKVLQQADPEASEQHLEQAVEAYRRLAAEPQAATDTLEGSSSPLQIEAFAGAAPGSLLPAEEREIRSVFLIAEAYDYMERYDQAIEVLEQLRSRFPHEARVFQTVTALVQLIRQEQEEKERSDASEEQALSTAPAAVGAVSP